MSMKHTFKTVSTVLVALGMTVCSVTALATNASAANDTNKNAPDSVGYTVDTSHNFDHQSSTDSTSVEGVTREPYSMAERPYYDRVYYSEAVFKDDAYSSIYFRQDSSLPYRFFTVIKNVPASDDPYMFYIQYKENPNTDPYIEATIDWDSINYTKVMKGGKYYAFKVTQQSDVTIEWDCYDNYVNAYGSNCYMVNSNTSVTEDVTYPTETFTATQPTEIPIYTSAPQPATTVEVASSAEQPTTAVVSYTLGDANLDGVININDATLVQRFVAKIYNPNEIQKFVADADKDGIITIKDATLIQKIVAKVK